MINVDTFPPALDKHHHLRVCFAQNVLSIHLNQSITWSQTRKRQRKSETPCEGHSPQSATGAPVIPVIKYLNWICMVEVMEIDYFNAICHNMALYDKKNKCSTE